MQVKVFYSSKSSITVTNIITQLQVNVPYFTVFTVFKVKVVACHKSQVAPVSVIIIMLLGHYGWCINK